MRHVTALPDDTRLGLAAASALRKPSLRQLRALGVADSLPAAERAGLIRIDGHDVVFTHPIYAAAAYDALAPTERMQLHTRLATVVHGDEERARHLALGADDADEAVAPRLDLARERALAARRDAGRARRVRAGRAGHPAGQRRADRPADRSSASCCSGSATPRGPAPCSPRPPA